MSSSTVTLIGLNTFLEYYEKDLFENLTFPEGIDKQTAINNILLFCGDNELLYPDAEFMIEAIKLWSTKWYFTFDKWVKVLAMEYNPIENYDRMEAWSDSSSMSESMSSSESNSASASDSSSSTGSNTANVSAFNSSTMQPDTSAADQNNNIAASTSNASGTTSRTEDETNYSEHEGRVHGNIGVTTTQQMIEQEIKLGRFNIYDEIAVIFAREFVLAL